MNGTIKTLNSRGFGFITSDDIDYFFHYTNYEGDWKKLVQKFISRHNGDQIYVEFDHDVSATAGPKAINVKLRG